MEFLQWSCKRQHLPTVKRGLPLCRWDKTVMILWGKTYASRIEEKRLPRGERSFSKLLITFGIRALILAFWDLRVGTCVLDCRLNLIRAPKRISAAIASHHFYCSADNYCFLLPPVNPAAFYYCYLLPFIATASYFNFLVLLSASCHLLLPFAAFC